MMEMFQEAMDALPLAQLSQAGHALHLQAGANAMKSAEINSSSVLNNATMEISSTLMVAQTSASSRKVSIAWSTQTISAPAQKFAVMVLTLGTGHAMMETQSAVMDAQQLANSSSALDVLVAAQRAETSANLLYRPAHLKSVRLSQRDLREPAPISRSVYQSQQSKEQ
jgi:N6-adenosine-specific RNA methylase IME4